MNDLVTLRGDEFEFFVPLSKINEQSGEFEAWASLEEIDASKEIIDIDKSMPYFDALADRFAKATDGANFGPVREQHDPNKASGHLIDRPVVKQYDESGKRGIYVHGLVTDDQTKKKLYAKTLTGISIGGRYVGELEKVTIGGREAKRFVADPNHYGLVDAPCVKGALVTVVKMDGTEKVEKIVGFDPPQGFLCRGEEFHERKPDALRCVDHVVTKTVAMATAADDMQKIAERADTNADEGKSKYGDVKFADEKNKKYPIDTKTHIEAAWKYINKGKNAAKYSAEDAKTIKGKIVAAWKAKIDKDGPPSAEKSDNTSLLEKCLQCVARLAYAADSIDDLADGIHCDCCNAYGCACDPRCVGPRCGCCYACNMQFGADAPLSDSTTALLEQASKTLMDAVVAASNDARAADEAEDAEEEAEATMKAIDALTTSLKDRIILSKLQTALRVPQSNGSLKKTKEGIMPELTEKNETAVDGAALNKSMGDLNKSVGEMLDLMKADRTKTEERFTAVDDDMKKLDEGFSELSKRLAQALAFVTEVVVDDPTDLVKVSEAIAKKPARATGSLRAMRKTEDSTADNANAAIAPIRHAFDVEPMQIAQIG